MAKTSRLTDVFIRQIAPPERGQKTYWDGGGFGLRISQAGTRTFVIKIGGKWITVGRYPDLSLAEARKKLQTVTVIVTVKTVTVPTVPPQAHGQGLTPRLTPTRWTLPMRPWHH